MIDQNIGILEETLLSGRRLNRDVARSLVQCTIPASDAACGATGLPPGSSWGAVARSALLAKRKAGLP